MKQKRSSSNLLIILLGVSVSYFLFWVIFPFPSPVFFSDHSPGRHESSSPNNNDTSPYRISHSVPYYPVPFVVVGCRRPSALEALLQSLRNAIQLDMRTANTYYGARIQSIDEIRPDCVFLVDTGGSAKISSVEEIIDSANDFCKVSRLYYSEPLDVQKHPPSTARTLLSAGTNVTEQMNEVIGMIRNATGDIARLRREMNIEEAPNRRQALLVKMKNLTKRVLDLRNQYHSLRQRVAAEHPSLSKTAGTGAASTRVNATRSKSRRKNRGSVILVKRLKRMWLWMMVELFVNATSPTGPQHTFAKDLVFLEDDLIVAPDFAKVVRFMSTIKARVPGIIATALAGWGGEHMVNANIKDFVVQEQRKPFPNMGYAVNQTLIRELFDPKSAVFREFRRPPKRGKSEREDWDNSLGRVLESTMIASRVIRPTFSRIWHTGTKGVHAWEDEYIRMLPPWFGFPSCTFTYHPRELRLKSRLRDVFGYPCANQSADAIIWQVRKNLSNMLY